MIQSHAYRHAHNLKQRKAAHMCFCTVSVKFSRSDEKKTKLKMHKYMQLLIVDSIQCVEIETKFNYYFKYKSINDQPK